MTEEAAAASIGNRFDRMEIAGAFGDLGTLIPLRGRLLGRPQDGPVWRTVLLRDRDACVRLGLPHADPCTADEGGRRHRHHPGGTDAHADPGDGSRRKLDHGSYLAGAGPDRHSEPRREPDKTSCCGWHRPVPRLRLHDRRRKDDVAELVDRQCGVLGVEGYHTAVGR